MLRLPWTLVKIWWKQNQTIYSVLERDSGLFSNYDNLDELLVNVMRSPHVRKVVDDVVAWPDYLEFRVGKGVIAADKTATTHAKKKLRKGIWTGLKIFIDEPGSILAHGRKFTPDLSQAREAYENWEADELRKATEGSDESESGGSEEPTQPSDVVPGEVQGDQRTEEA